MPALLTATANDTLNRVGVEVGLDPVTDPWSSTEKNYIQMRTLLNVAGEELSQHYPWEFLIKEHTFTTTTDDEYDLPDDFLYILNQTGWDRTNDLPLTGPLSPQNFQNIKGREIGTIYVSFRIQQGKFKLLPDPATSGLTIAFEYVSRNWVLDSTDGTSYIDSVQTGADTPQFDRTLLSRFLKVKYLEAKGLDATKAQADLNQSFGLLTAHDKAAPILNAGRNMRGYPYLSSRFSVPDTGYGS